MPELWTEAARMLTAGLLVALVAVPIGLLARAARPAGEPLLPRWKPWRAPWSGFEVLAAFFVITRALPVLVYLVLSKLGFYTQLYGADFPTLDAPGVDAEQTKDASTLRVLWASLLALPLALGLLWTSARMFYPAWRPIRRGSTAGKVRLTVLAWLVLAPVVLAFNAIVNAIALKLDVTPDAHALTKLGGHPLMDQVLFVLQACVAAPLVEEILFRGLLLSWCVGRIKIPGAGVAPATAARPWFVMGTAVLYAFLEGNTLPPVVFAGLLLAGLGVLWRFTHTGARRARAVYATAALFAVVHSSVWPSPIPLFLLGLGLGWLAVRTNGVLVPVLVHALFNAVSVVFVLRGGAG